MVDIHSHILPGIDDGAKSMEESVRMAEIAASENLNHIVASSHGNYYNYTLEEYEVAFSDLQAVLAERNIPVKLHPGMELYLDEDVFEKLDERQLLSLNYTDYLLTEFNFEEKPEKVWYSLRRLMKNGYRIVLAHPERYRFIQRDIEVAYFLVEQGCILQINQGSFIGAFGETCRRVAYRLLRDRLVGVIGTDAHDTCYRAPKVNDCIRVLRREYSDYEIRLWFSENPSRILKGYSVIGRNMGEKEGV